MVYLRVAHVDKQLDEEVNDCDLFRFSTLDRAIQYIKNENIEEFILSDFVADYEPEDHTMIF